MKRAAKELSYADVMEQAKQTIRRTFGLSAGLAKLRAPFEQECEEAAARCRAAGMSDVQALAFLGAVDQHVVNNPITWADGLDTAFRQWRAGVLKVDGGVFVPARVMKSKRPAGDPVQTVRGGVALHGDDDGDPDD